MKSFSTLRDTQRLHGEEKREGVVRGGWNEMRWDQKRREQASQYTLPYVCSTVLTTQRFTELGKEEKGKGGDRGCQEDKRGNQKERDRSSQ